MKGSWLESDWLVDFSGLHSNALFEELQLTSLTNANSVASKRRQKDLSNRTERCATLQNHK